MRARCLLFDMRCHLHFVKIFLPGVMVVITFAMATSVLNISPPAEFSPERGDNPDKFHLWRTNSGCDCFFTYDPRGADEWLFHYGSRLETNWQ